MTAISLSAPTPVSTEQPRRCCGCLRQIPKDTVKAAGKSFLYSIVAGTLLTGGNIVLGFYSGVGSMVASLIDSLIRPLINLFFSREDRNSDAYYWTKFTVSTFIYVALAIFVTPLIGLNLQIGFIASVATRIVLGFFPSSGIRPVDNSHAEVFTFIYV